ncbi:hypothetical protein [Flavobacterium sp.]|uniref:hypothetical protein n=1 Tax=Flavobacterium sp. TaxID=239 RepID=UPI003D145B09
MTNCSTEQGNENDVSSPSAEAKIWYENHKKEFNATILNHIDNLEWENAIISDGDKGEVIEVPFTLQNNLSTSNKIATLYNDHHRLMFIKDAENGFKLYHIQIFSDKQDSKIIDKEFNYYNIQKDFDGKVYVQDLSIGVGERLEFKKGSKILPSIASKSATDDAEAIECLWYGYWYEDGHFEPIELVYCSLGDSPVQYPNPNYGGGGSGGSGGTGGTSGTAPIKITSEAQLKDLIDSTDGTGYNITYVKQTTNVVTEINMKIMPWLSVLYVVTAVKVGTSYEVTSVASALNQASIGNTWQQLAFAAAPGPNNVTYVSVISLFGAGIDTGKGIIGINNEILYIISVNTKTGKIMGGNRP